jgi:hypothetical protein
MSTSSSTIVNPPITSNQPTNNRRQRNHDGKVVVEEGERKRLKFSDGEEGQSSHRTSPEVHDANDEEVVHVEAELMKYVLWVDMVSDAHDLFFDQRARFNHRR